jgi:hypothetical protein
VHYFVPAEHTNLSKSVLKKCTPMPPAFLANHVGNFTTGWVDAVNPQPFLDAGVWPHRTFFDKNANRHPGKPGNLLPWRSGSHHAYQLPDRQGRLEIQWHINEINRSGVRLATRGLEKRSVANRAESIKKEPPMERFLHRRLCLQIC